MARKKKGQTSASKGAPAPKNSGSGDSKPWSRIAKGGLNSHADWRDVDTDAVLALLTERAAAKAANDFGTADVRAAALRAMGVCYLDATREWYTRAVNGAATVSGSARGDVKRKRPAQDKPPDDDGATAKPKPKAKAGATAGADDDDDDDDDASSSDGVSEDEREDDAFVARMQVRLAGPAAGGAKGAGGAARERADADEVDGKHKKKPKTVRAAALGTALLAAAANGEGGEKKKKKKKKTPKGKKKAPEGSGFRQGNCDLQLRLANCEWSRRRRGLQTRPTAARRRRCGASGCARRVANLHEFRAGTPG